MRTVEDGNTTPVEDIAVIGKMRTFEEIPAIGKTRTLEEITVIGKMTKTRWECPLFGKEAESTSPKDNILHGPVCFGDQVKVCV